jgi:RimJ/RimL family protein N-acetyltransferase
MERGEEWHWTLRLKADPEVFIGCISLMKTRPGNRGFWLLPEYQRRGLMTEAADAVTDFWFDVLGEPEIRVAKAIANTASRRISEKNGMRVIATEERDYVCGRLPTEIWSMTAEEWRRHRAVTG